MSRVKALSVNYLILSRVFLVFGLVVVGVLLCWHFFQVVSLNEKEFLLRSYQATVGGLSEENKTLEIKQIQNLSLKNIESIVVGLDFEKVGRIHYIRMLPEQVARAGK